MSSVNTMSLLHLRTKISHDIIQTTYKYEGFIKCDTGTTTGSMTVCVCLWYTCTMWILFQNTDEPDPEKDRSYSTWTLSPYEARALSPVRRRIFYTRAWPHLSWTVSFSTDACRSSAVLWVLCRMSRSFRSCSRVSANSTCAAWSCPSRTWTRWTPLSRSASQRWSFSSRSFTGRGKKEKKEERKVKSERELCSSGPDCLLSAKYK